MIISEIAYLKIRTVNDTILVQCQISFSLNPCPFLMLSFRNFSWLIQKQIISKLLVEKNHAPLLIEKTSTNSYQVPRAILGTVCEMDNISALNKLM